MKIASIAPVKPRLMMVLMFSLIVSAVSVSTLIETPLVASSSFNWAISSRTRCERSMILTSGDLEITQVITSFPFTRE